MPDHDSAAGQPEGQADAGSTRRGMLRGAAGLGAAGLAAAFLTGKTATLTAAATPDHEDNIPAADHDEPLIVHVHDARTGVVDLFTGTRQVRVTDPQLAARLARAAR
ncbi:MAG: hypothetical protein ACRDN0_17590 [Trebonia sp.]